MFIFNPWKLLDLSIRAQFMDAKNNGERCEKSAMPSILELGETETCNVIDCPPGMSKRMIKIRLDKSYPSWLWRRTMGVMEFLHSHMRRGQQKQEKVHKNQLPWLSMIISLFRVKNAGAVHNGTKCASQRTIPLTETDTCNLAVCPPGNMIFRVWHIKKIFSNSWLWCRAVGFMDFLLCHMWWRQQRKDKVQRISPAIVSSLISFIFDQGEDSKRCEQWQGLWICQDRHHTSLRDKYLQLARLPPR